MEKKANPNHYDGDGYTALMYAVSNNNYYLVKALLGAHADPSLKNNQGRTALNLAVHGSSVFKLLEPKA